MKTGPICHVEFAWLRLMFFLDSCLYFVHGRPVRDARGSLGESVERGSTELHKEAIMTRDEMIREYRMRGASWPALVGVYAIILGTMVLSAMAITG